MFTTAMFNQRCKSGTAGTLLLRLVAVMVLFSFGCATAGVNNPIPVTQEKPLPSGDPSFALGSGDVITVKVFRHDDLTLTSMKVRMDGTISVPLIGEFKVTDMPVKDAEKKLEEKLAYYIVNPKVSINAVTISSKKIFVLGEVTNQTVITMEEPMTLLQAIAKAGGVTGSAKTSEVSLIRGAQVYTVDLNRALKGDQSQNINLMAGDAVYVRPTVIATLGSYFSAIGTIMGFLISIESGIILTQQVSDIFKNKTTTNTPSLSIPTK
ncbi:polysaccharide biosynthesis/export family protein [Candidatus Magnetominusculus xianensis]|uniref:Polysaccharide export protein n=1 Tax=Candidatus Magnetominusculus xianensis TaxID=1748249 RepID=A0ABR5SGT6_9BACT|nr:polysaccharide biosynthesis/export family protein [Candidatus Magnetominusculus xianensis]KWT90528.1 polysaccharide export protein [Candidatus Magnetominusculus xianensis]MBF0404147.1 polysaccharide export protein [Nitrospirota bacterium]